VAVLDHKEIDTSSVKHSFLNQPIPICIGNIVLGFHVSNDINPIFFTDVRPILPICHMSDFAYIDSRYQQY